MKGPKTFFAACGPGFEGVLAAELRGIGAAEIVERRGGVEFLGDARTGMQACLRLRTALRVQEQLLEVPARGPRELYAAVAELDWEALSGPDRTIAVDATVRDSDMTHSQYAALVVKDAVVDQLRERCGRRPDVDTESPDLPLRLHLRENTARLYRDWSGESLHKRGWRPALVKSPLNEATAAGLLLLTEWDRESPLADPMCGGGTFLVEAAHLAMDRAPGLRRSFAFERWPDYDDRAWRALRREAEQRVKPGLRFPIEGCDLHPGAIPLARRAVEAAGVAGVVRVSQGDCRTWNPTRPPRIVCTNPPWGERIGEGEDLVASWKALGNFLHRCSDATAFVLSGNAELTRHLGLRASRKWVVRNGPIEGRWLRYEIGAPARAGRKREIGYPERS
ncbi:MAG: RNA methyltransferase [Candidatus Brocadiae bacterium]|nr:RNA methyltransferase [Candidatus Brocadiia bacterium]